MALGGTIRGKRARLRMPIEADLDAYARWAADVRLRRAHRVWHEPAMPATWKERLGEAAKEQRSVLWSIESNGGLIGMAVAHMWSAGGGVDLEQFTIDPGEWRTGLGFDVALALHRYFFDYLDLRVSTVDLRADNVAALRIADKLGYVEYARGHEVHYRDGGYVDETKLLMTKETWHERWATEREYERLPAEALR